MEEFTILCTEEQTNKSLLLGAPIEIQIHIEPEFSMANGCLPYPEEIEIPICPTAEQMMGWLRTKGFAFGISEYNDGFNDHVFWRVANNQDKRWYKSDNKLKDPKDAVLAAIDAALKYLIEKKDK